MRRRLLISSLLGTVPLILLGIVLLIVDYHTTRNRILGTNLAHAELASTYIDGWLDGNIRILESFAISNEVQNGTTADIKALLIRQIRVHSEWENLFVTDATGQEIADALHAPINISQRAYFNQVKRTRRPVVSNSLLSLITEHRIIVIAYPIIRQGRFSGVMGAAIRSQQIERLFTLFPPGLQQIISVWGSDDALIARTTTPDSMLGQSYTLSEAAKILHTRHGTIVMSSPLTRQRKLYGYSHTEIAPWVVLVSTPLVVALHPIYRTMALFLIVALLVLAATIGWSIFSANVVAREVSLLADSARAIGAGKYTTRVTLHTGDELEDLANSLSKMAGDLAVLERLKSDLLSLVSHELKTPLTTIRSFLDVLAGGILTPDNPQYPELLASADRQTRRLQDMIENLLNVARLDVGGLAVTPRPTTLISIVHSSVHQYEAIVREKGLALIVDVPEDICVLADPPKISLVINNLLDNAVKFSEQGSITIKATTEGDKAVVTVMDTGKGLSPEEQARMFERFYQAEPLLTRRVGGAGLGLVVVKAIVASHGGRVFAYSNGPDQGSTFGFTLPLAKR